MDDIFDGISARVLKVRADQLGISSTSSVLAFNKYMVPELWKTSCLVPPSFWNVYRPVALISHEMKLLNRLALFLLRPQVRSLLDCHR